MIDASYFAATFWEVIVQSVPHIYLSALPFTPSNSLLAKNFTPHLQHKLCVTKGKAVAWAPIHGVMSGHREGINCIAFSLDGKHVVSGSSDNTIQIWDVETGLTLAGPFKGNTSHVNSVAFSPDGKHVVSGSYDNTIRVWNAETGLTVAGPFKGHTSDVNTVAFSPDGKHVDFRLIQQDNLDMEC